MKTIETAAKSQPVNPFLFRFHKCEGEDWRDAIEVTRKGEETPFLWIIGNYYDCARLGKTVVGVLDSDTAELGEIAWQLYENPYVRRKPYVPSHLFAFSYIRDEDVPAYETLSPEEMECIAHGAIDLIRRNTDHKRHEILFAYLGNEEFSPVDKTLLETFKKAGFAVFRCVKGLTCDVDSYIAVYSSKAIGSAACREAQKATEYFPKALEEDDEEFL